MSSRKSGGGRGMRDGGDRGSGMGVGRGGKWIATARAVASAIASSVAGSVVGSAARAVAGSISRAARASAALGFVARPERSTRLFYASASGSLLSRAACGASGALRRFGAWFGRRFPESVTLWFAKWLGERFCLLFCAFAAIHALTPYELYRNQYTVAAMAFFLLCAASRVAFSAGGTDGTYRRSIGTVGSISERRSVGTVGSVASASSAASVASASSSASVDGSMRTDPALLLYFCAVAASGAFSLLGAGAGLASTTTATLYLTAILFAFLVPCAFAEPRRLGALIAVIVASATAMSLYGIFQYIRGVPIDVTQTDQQTGGASLAMGRVDATVGNPNVLAGWLILAIPFGVSLFFGVRGLRAKLLAAAAVAPCFLCLLLTQSRSGWVGLAAAAVTYLFLLEWRLVPALAAAGALSMPLWPQFILDRFMTLGADTSSVYRITIWSGSFRMAVGNMFTGVGIGLEYFRRFINNYVYFPYETAPVHSHMLPLQIWLESGIVAAAAFAWFALRMVKKGVARVFAARRENAASDAGDGRCRLPIGRQGMRLTLTACVSGFVGFLAMGVFEYVWFFPRCMNMFFIVAGVFVCALRIESARQAQ